MPTRDAATGAVVNDAACAMQNKAREQLLALEPEIILGVSRAELEGVYDALIAGRSPCR